MRYCEINYAYSPIKAYDMIVNTNTYHVNI